MSKLENAISQAVESLKKNTPADIAALNAEMTADPTLIPRSIQYHLSDIRNKSGLNHADWIKAKPSVIAHLKNATMAQTDEGVAVTQATENAGKNLGAIGGVTATIFAYFKSWFGSKEKGVSFFRKLTKGLKKDSWLKIAFGALIGEDPKEVAEAAAKKKEAAAKAAKAATANPAEAEKATSDKLEQTRRDLVGKYTGLNLTTKDSISTDVQTLIDNNLIEDPKKKPDALPKLLETAMSGGGSLRKVRYAVTTVTPGSKNVNFRYADLLLQKKSPEEVTAITDAIKDQNNTLPKTQAGMREFLDKLIAEPNVSKVIDLYKKPAAPAPRAEAREIKQLKATIDMNYSQIASLVTTACNNINGHFDTILKADGDTMFVTGTVAKKRAKIEAIKSKITGIQRKIAGNPQTYQEKLALLKTVRADLFKAQKRAADKGVSSMLSSKGQAAQKEILRIMADAKKGSEPLFASIETNTSKLTA